ncbi:ROK family protein [Chloroflexota bacterium]
MTEDRSPLVALDLGGSKIATALVNPDGKIVGHRQIPTLAEEGVDAVVSRMLVTIDSVVNEAGLSLSGVSSIAIAAAGAIDSRQGIVTDSPNLPGWRDVPLREIVKKAVGLETFLINDASAAAIGEHCFGAGRDVSDLVYVTVSTGIGGGILIAGKLHEGVSGSAGEVGHMTIDVNGPRCSCGNVGCLEVFASGKAVAREAQSLVSQGVKTKITEYAEGQVENITARTVAEAAQQGDVVARQVIFRAATYLGIGLVNLVNILNPEMIIIGGGLSQMGDILLDPARQVVADRAFQLPAQRVRIVPSQLGVNAGTLGAAAFAQGSGRPF